MEPYAMLTVGLLTMALFGFKSKKGDVLQHWIGMADGFNQAPQEFYTEVERQLTVRKVPGLEISRVEFSEGGILSEKRTYMRMIRERLVFDACAAPFGTGYFFSCRTVYIPPLIKLWHVLIIILVFTAIHQGLASFLGNQLASIAVAGLIIAIAAMFQNAIALGLADIDAALIKTPVIGPVYERFFRKKTYYREDSRFMYLEMVPKIIQELALEVTAAKGVKLVRQYEQAPVFGELYKRLPPKEK